MRGEKWRFPARTAVGAHQRMSDGAEVFALFGRNIGESDRLARMNQRMFADEVLGLRLRLFIQRVVGRAHVCKFCVTAA